MLLKPQQTRVPSVGTDHLRGRRLICESTANSMGRHYREHHVGNVNSHCSMFQGFRRNQFDVHYGYERSPRISPPQSDFSMPPMTNCCQPVHAPQYQSQLPIMIYQPHTPCRPTSTDIGGLRYNVQPSNFSIWFRVVSKQPHCYITTDVSKTDFNEAQMGA